MRTTHTFTVGETAYITNYARTPVKVTVARLTKTQIVVAYEDGAELRDRFRIDTGRKVGDNTGYSGYTYLEPYSDQIALALARGDMQTAGSRVAVATDNFRRARTNEDALAALEKLEQTVARAREAYQALIELEKK